MSEKKSQASKPSKSLFVSFLAICSVLGYVSAATFDEVSKPHLLRRGGAVDTVGLNRPKISTRDEMMETAEDLAIVFSDIDGTLVHYPTTDERQKGVQEESSDDNRILELPPSSTGMKGVISSKTLRQCQDIRRQGVKLVLVSGMRSSTLLKRLPYLPRADAYCCEAGGRIFYPIHQQQEDAAGLTVTPASYDGARAQDLEAFRLVEDMDWRREMERIKAAGKDGFVSNELGDDNNQAPMSIADRDGTLWEFARRLLADGYVLDTKGYASCFRVNRNQQTPDMSKEAFDALSDGAVAYPSELSTSTNLGCVDFYPVASGKKNCCEYLANKFSGGSTGNGDEKNVLARQTVCLCDDDNDIEMARACLHAYVPSISSTSLVETIRSSPLQFTATCDDDNNVEGTHATEVALALILGQIAMANAKPRK